MDTQSQRRLIEVTIARLDQCYDLFADQIVAQLSIAGSRAFLTQRLQRIKEIDNAQGDPVPPDPV